MRSTAESYLGKDIAVRDGLLQNEGLYEGTRISWKSECLPDLKALQAFLLDAQSESKPRISIEPVSRPIQLQSQTAEFLRKLNTAKSPSYEAERRIVPQARLPLEREFQFPRKVFIEWQGRIFKSQRPPKLLIHGHGGTGKTHLLLMLAHLVIEPASIATDNSAGLYVDLLGYSGQTGSQEECLRKLLGSLLSSTYYDLPERLEDLHDLYTQQLEERHLTVYPDNVLNFDQVELAIPPNHCGCVISARENFAIDRFDVINVTSMDDAEAVAFALQCFPVGLDKSQCDDLLTLTDEQMLEIAQRIAKICKGHALRIAAMFGGFRDEFKERPDWDTLLAELETKTRTDVDDLFEGMYSGLKEYKDAARRLSVFPRDFDLNAANCVLHGSSGNALTRLSRCNVLTPIRTRRNGKNDLRYLMHDEFRAYLRKKLSEGKEVDDCFELLTKYFSDLSQLSIPPEHRLVDDGKEFIFASDLTIIYEIRDWLCGQKLSCQRRTDALKFAEVWHSTLAQRSDDTEENTRFVMEAIDWASKTKGFNQLHFDLLLSNAELLKRNKNRKGAEPVLESAIEVAKLGLKPKDVSQALFDLIFLVVDWLNACRMSGVSKIDAAIDWHIDSVVEPLLKGGNNAEALEILTSATRLHFTSGNATNGWKYLELARKASKQDASLSSLLREAARQLLRSLSEFSEFERLLEELEAWHKADAILVVVQERLAESATASEDATCEDVVSSEIADLYDDAGLRFERESKFSTAIDYYWKSLRAAERANDARMIRVAWQRLIRANLQRRDHEAAGDSARMILARLQADDSLSEEDRDQFITTGRAFVGELLRLAQRDNEAWQEFDAAHAAAIAAESDDLQGLVLGCVDDLECITDTDVREKEFSTAVEFLRQHSHFDAYLRLYAIQLSHAARTCSPEIVERVTKEFVTVAAEIASRGESGGSIAIAPYAILVLRDESLALRALSELHAAVGVHAGRALEFPLRLARVMILQHCGHTPEAIECVRGFSEISSAMTDEQQCEAHTQIVRHTRKLLTCSDSTVSSAKARRYIRGSESSAPKSKWTPSSPSLRPIWQC